MPTIKSLKQKKQTLKHIIAMKIDPDVDFDDKNQDNLNQMAEELHQQLECRTFVKLRKNEEGFFNFSVRGRFYQVSGITMSDTPGSFVTRLKRRLKSKSVKLIVEKLELLTWKRIEILTNQADSSLQLGFSDQAIDYLDSAGSMIESYQKIRFWIFHKDASDQDEGKFVDLEYPLINHDKLQKHMREIMNKKSEIYLNYIKRRIANGDEPDSPEILKLAEKIILAKTRILALEDSANIEDVAKAYYEDWRNIFRLFQMEQTTNNRFWNALYEAVKAIIYSIGAAALYEAIKILCQVGCVGHYNQREDEAEEFRENLKAIKMQDRILISTIIGVKHLDLIIGTTISLFLYNASFPDKITRVLQKSNKVH